MAWKQVGVVLAQKSAVRKAEIRQLLIAESSTDHIHVPCRTDCVHKWDEIPTSRPAAGGEVLVRIDPGLVLLLIVEHRITRVERVPLRAVDTRARGPCAAPR